MEPEHTQESSERDELWLSLRALRPDIIRLGMGEWDASERQQQIVSLLARIVLAEIDFRERGQSPGGEDPTPNT
jgi:hypothetical protein